MREGVERKVWNGHNVSYLKTDRRDVQGETNIYLIHIMLLSRNGPWLIPPTRRVEDVVQNDMRHPHHIKVPDGVSSRSGVAWLTEVWGVSCHAAQ